jgi:hypothetical protein
MELEIMTLNRTSQTQKDKHHMFSFIAESEFLKTEARESRRWPVWGKKEICGRRKQK